MTSPLDRKCDKSILTYAGVGAGIGGLVGSAQAAWGDTGFFLGGRAVPAIRGAALTCLKQSMFFGGCCAAFEGTRCLASSLRGKVDKWNGFYGAAGVGAVIGVRNASVKTFTVTAGVLGASLLLFGYFDNSASPTMTALRAQGRAKARAEELAQKGHH